MCAQNWLCAEFNGMKMHFYLIEYNICYMLQTYNHLSFFLIYLLLIDAESSNKVGNNKFSEDEDIFSEVRNYVFLT